MSKRIRIAGFLMLLGASCLGRDRIHAQQFDYVKSDGCAHVFLYGWNVDRNEVIVVRADREQLTLAVGTNKLIVTPDRKGLQVYIDLYARTQSYVDYCTDVRPLEQDRPLATLHALSGELIVILGEPGAVKGRQPFMYDATVTLRDMAFRHPDGSVVSMKTPVTLKAVVGYVWG
jgi:hypothetical protein